MVRALKILTLVAVVTAIPARAWATPDTNGFWTKANSDGYTLFLESYDTIGAAANNGTNQAMLGLAIDSSFLYVMLAQQTSVNDNSYGGGAVGWGAGHTLANLIGTDQAGFVIKSSVGGSTVFANFVDYIACTSGIDINGCQAALTTGIEAGSSIPTSIGASALADAHSSLQWTLNHASTVLQNNCGHVGNTSSYRLDSPAASQANYDANQLNNFPTVSGCNRPGEDWLFPMIWELKINLSLLGLDGITDVNTIHNLIDVTQIHNSPEVKGLDTNACDDPHFTGAAITGICGDGHAVPEPASLMLVGSGALLLVGLLRRRKAA